MTEVEKFQGNLMRLIKNSNHYIIVCFNEKNRGPEGVQYNIKTLSSTNNPKIRSSLLKESIKAFQSMIDKNDELNYQYEKLDTILEDKYKILDYLLKSYFGNDNVMIESKSTKMDKITLNVILKEKVRNSAPDFQDHVLKDFMESEKINVELLVRYVK